MKNRSLERILLVDDDEDIRRIGELSLERVGGFEVEICACGEEALQRAPQFQPDLVLLDVMMPEMGGVAVYEALSDLDEVADVPVIFVTAKAQTQEVARYLVLGAIGVIKKPFDPMMLADEIRAIWARRIEGGDGKTDEQEQLYEMVVDYGEKLKRRLESFDRLLARLSQPSPREAMKEARDLAHKLAGSGAMFGMPEVSETCSELEGRLSRLLADDRAPTQAELDELQQLCRRLRARIVNRQTSFSDHRRP